MVSDKNNEKHHDEELPLEENSESGSSKVDVKTDYKPLDWNQVLQKELGFAKLLDFVCNEPYDLVFQEKLFDTYKKEIIHPLLGDVEEPEDIDGGRLELRENYQSMKIDEKTHAILNKAEEICRSKGIKKPIQKRISQISLYLMSTIMVISVAFILIPQINQYYTYVMFGMIAVFCIVPQVLRNALMNKWKIFKNENRAPLIEAESQDIADLNVFTQIVLDDARDRLLEKHIPLQDLQFVLYSKNYVNLKLIRQQDAQGVKNFIMQFEYPEGVTPFASKNNGLAVSKQEVPDDDENDEFILLKNATFDEEGALENYSMEYPAKTQYPKIEALLGTCEFMDIDNPRAVIFSFNTNRDIACACGEPVSFKKLKNCESEEFGGFEFYFGIGNKCKCGNNPFVLFTSPGNKETPESLKEIFD